MYCIIIDDAPPFNISGHAPFDLSLYSMFLLLAVAFLVAVIGIALDGQGNLVNSPHQA